MGSNTGQTGVTIEHMHLKMKVAMSCRSRYMLYMYVSVYGTLKQHELRLFISLLFIMQLAKLTVKGTSSLSFVFGSRAIPNTTLLSLRVMWISLTTFV